MNFENYKTELDFLNTMFHSFRLLLIASNAVQKLADSKLKGITMRQHMILVAVDNMDSNKTNIVNIAEILGTSKQNVTRLVNYMIESGYLMSTPCSDDKRSINLKLTDKGHKICDENYHKSNEYLLDIFNDFSVDELNVFYNNLIKLVAFDKAKKEAFENSLKITLNGKYTKEKIGILKALSKSDKFKK